MSFYCFFDSGFILHNVSYAKYAAKLALASSDCLFSAYICPIPPL